jgi:hypothetical protein
MALRAALATFFMPFIAMIVALVMGGSESRPRRRSFLCTNGGTIETPVPARAVPCRRSRSSPRTSRDAGRHPASGERASPAAPPRRASTHLS